MNTDGEIRQLMDGEKPKRNEVPLGKLPDPNCPDCYGRGFQRFLIENVTETRPCHCTRNTTPFDALLPDRFIDKLRGCK